MAAIVAAIVAVAAAVTSDVVSTDAGAAAMSTNCCVGEKVNPVPAEFIAETVIAYVADLSPTRKPIASAPLSWWSPVTTAFIVVVASAPPDGNAGAEDARAFLEAGENTGADGESGVGVFRG